MNILMNLYSNMYEVKMKLYSNMYEVKRVRLRTKKIALPFSISELLPFDEIFD